jgi:hypothetical protein
MKGHNAVLARFGSYAASRSVAAALGHGPKSLTCRLRSRPGRISGHDLQHNPLLTPAPVLRGCHIL